MLITIIILAISAIFFVSGKIRSDLVALCALVALLLCHILTPEEALSGFSSSVVIMMIGLFVVGGAIFQTGLAKIISSRILKLAGKSETRLFLLVILATAAIGAFVSNTGTVALMLPIVVSLAMSAGMNPSRLLMPLAFASSMGGMMTLIGTPPNLVIQDTLTAAGYEPLSFFSFLPVGLVCLLVGIIVLMPLSKLFLSGRKKREDDAKSGKSLKQLVNEYGLSHNLFRLLVTETSKLAGSTVIELDIRRKYGLNILEIRRGDLSRHRFLKTIAQKLASPDAVLQANDILYVTGDFNRVKEFADEYAVSILDGHATEETNRNENSLDFYDIGIAEIVLMPTSLLINRTVKEIGFRDKYNVNVLGIRRQRDYLLRDLGDKRVHSGDVACARHMEQHCPLGTRRDRLGGIGAASCRSRQSNPRLQGSRSRRHHAADDSNDGFRLHPRSPRDFGHDSRHPDGFNRLFPECGSGIQNHQLGKRGTNRRHAADVARAGENRSIGIHIQCTGKRFGQLRSFRTLGRHLLYHLAAHHVHQQHGYGGASCPDCPPQCRAARHQSRPVPVCGSRRRKHVFRLPVFHTAQCAGHARRTIYIYGLRKGRASASNHHGYRNGICASVALPVLSEKTLRVRPLISTHRNELRYRLRKATLPHKFSDCSNKKA